MRAAILQDGEIRVGEFPDPTPIEGQVLVSTHRCAICASDAHFLHSAATVVELSAPNVAGLVSALEGNQAELFAEAEHAVITREAVLWDRMPR